MRVIVCGGRHYADKWAVFEALDRVDTKNGIDLVIHGAMTGADTLAEEWARARCIPYMGVPADWATYEHAAGPRRNQQMLELCPDGVIAFPGGKGTLDMVSRAKKAGVPVWQPVKETRA